MEEGRCEDSGPGSMTNLELREREKRVLPEEELSSEVGLALFQEHGKHFDMAFPSPVTGDCWEICPRGVVGVIPLSDGGTARVDPKVSLSNLFGMMDVAYGFGGTRFLEGLMDMASLEDLFSELARLLAGKVLERAKKGLYRDYLERREDLMALRGRLDFRTLTGRPASVRLPCRYDENTADVAENRVIAWTLGLLLRHFLSGRDRELKYRLRKAFHTYAGAASMEPCTGQDCLRFLYHRLNEDYRPLHSLCRFFLENCGPSLGRGDRKMVPFLVDMERLFESFVACWLKRHLAPGFRLSAQKAVNFTGDGWITGSIDMVLYEEGRVRAVMDTKYKVADKPSNDDFYQIVAYALAEGASEAVLVYPELPEGPREGTIRGIRVRTLVFPLGGDLDEGGRLFLRELLG